MQIGKVNNNPHFFTPQEPDPTKTYTPLVLADSRGKLALITEFAASYPAVASWAAPPAWQAAQPAVTKA